jgi:hypothetical protein
LPGYGHPDIGPEWCRLRNSGRKDCVIPGMTIGRYVIRASGTSMPMGPKARQQLTIIVANRNCAQVKDFTPWSGAPRTLTTECEISVMSDKPVMINVVYADTQALKTASGPVVTIERLPWDGVLAARQTSP